VGRPKTALPNAASLCEAAGRCDAKTGTDALNGWGREFSNGIDAVPGTGTGRGELKSKGGAIDVTSGTRIGSTATGMDDMDDMDGSCDEFLDVFVSAALCLSAGASRRCASYTDTSKGRLPVRSPRFLVVGNNSGLKCAPSVRIDTKTTNSQVARLAPQSSKTPRRRCTRLLECASIVPQSSETRCTRCDLTTVPAAISALPFQRYPLSHPNSPTV
jgi:hypothetical protein